MSITWEPSFETGNADIDSQHRELLRIVDELECAERDSADSHAAILAVLTHITDFVDSHFVMEEDLMRQVGYPKESTDEMIAQHREFTSYARLRVLEFRRGGVFSVMPLQSFLASWLTVHEFGLDRLLAEFIRQQGA